MSAPDLVKPFLVAFLTVGGESRRQLAAFLTEQYKNDFIGHIAQIGGVRWNDWYSVANDTVIANLVTLAQNMIIRSITCPLPD